MRRVWLVCLPLAWLAATAESAPAQQGATTVQLPTFSFFSVDTTVTVPDRGSAFLGGVNRAASGRNEFGVPLLPFRPFRNVAIGREVSASNMFVTATIHDLEAMDRYLLGLPTAARLPPLRRPQVAAMDKTLRPRDPGHGASWRVSAPAGAGSAPTMSVAQARAQRQRQQQTRAREAADFFQRGRKAETASKTGVAKIYYQMAARRATGQLKAQVAQKLDAIARAQTSAKIALSRP